MVVDAVEEAAMGSSFFCAHELKNATVASAVIRDKTVVFIGVVKLNEPRECRSSARRASTKNPSVFAFPILPFSRVILP